MNLDFYLLFYPIFWDEDKILGFLVEYCELLLQTRWSYPIKSIIDSLNSMNNCHVEKPCNPLITETNEQVHEGRCGWLSKVWELEETANGEKTLASFIGEYLPYTKQYDSYNGHLWFDMMRAIRNLYVHKYDSKIRKFSELTPELQNKVKQMQIRIRKLISDGYLKYWLDKFPSLLVVIYYHAVQNYEAFIKLPGTDEDCSLRTKFVEKFYLEETAKVSQIPKRLEDVVRNFANFAATEARTTSGLLLHSLKLVGGPNVHFMKYPTTKYMGGIFTPNEIVTMTLNLDNSTGNRNLTCKIDRKINASGENNILGFRQDLIKPKSALTFKETSVQNISDDVINKLYIFTDDIMCALLYQKMFFKSRNFQSIFIYTNKTFREVNEISTKVFEQLNSNIDKVEIRWENLDDDYKNKLYDKPFWFHKRSNTSQDLRKIYPKISECRIQGNQLLELMHDNKPALLSTGIPLHFNDKSFYARSMELSNSTANLKLMCDGTLKGNLSWHCNTKTVTLLYGSACMGKSWLLMSIGRYLETESKVVKFLKAIDFIRELKTEGNTDFDKTAIIKKIWFSSQLEQDIIAKITDQNRLIYLLLDDFDRIVDKIKKERLFHFLKCVREKLNVKLVLTLSKKDEILGFENYEVFSLKPVDINGFINHYFKNIVTTQPDDWKSYIMVLETEYKKQCKSLGDFNQTPFACGVWCSACEKCIDHTNLTMINNQLTITQIHNDLVEQKLKNYYPNYEQYVNKTVLLWPYLIKSFMERFCEFTPDLLKTGYITDLFGDKITLSALHTADFLQGTINDYLIVYLVEKVVFLNNAGSLRANMCRQLWEILQVDNNKNKFKYDSIVEFLDSKCSVEMIRQIVDASVDFHESVHDVLKFSLKFKYERLFVSILTNVDDYDQNINLTGLDKDDKIYAATVFKRACENKKYSVLYYLVQFNCVRWDHIARDDSTCLSYVERHITDPSQRHWLTQKINKWINPTDQQ